MTFVQGVSVKLIVEKVLAVKHRPVLLGLPRCFDVLIRLAQVVEESNDVRAFWAIPFQVVVLGQLDQRFHDHQGVVEQTALIGSVVLRAGGAGEEALVAQVIRGVKLQVDEVRQNKVPEVGVPVFPTDRAGFGFDDFQNIHCYFSFLTLRSPLS